MEMDLAGQSCIECPFQRVVKTSKEAFVPCVLVQYHHRKGKLCITIFIPAVRLVPI